MKRLAFLLVFYLLLNACNKIGQTPFLNISSGYLWANADETEEMIYFQATSRDNVIVSVSENWCSAKIMRDSNNNLDGTIIVQFSQNASVRERECIITISMDKFSYDVTLHQDGAQSFLKILNNSSIKLEYTPTTISVPISTNCEQITVDYTINQIAADYTVSTVTVQQLDWINFEGISSDKTLANFKISENKTSDTRDVRICLRGEDKAVANIDVRQYCFCELTVDPLEIYLSCDEQNFNFRVTSSNNSRVNDNVDNGSMSWIRRNGGSISFDGGVSWVYTYKVSANSSSNPRTGKISISLNHLQKDIIIHQEGYSEKDYVDLGLSVYWAKKNVGASSPSDVGVRTRWGDPTGNNSSSTYGRPYSDGSSISNTDSDIAKAKLGKGWRLPTKAECQELLNYCTWTETTENGISGMKATRNGNSVFFPYYGTGKTRGYYWSATAAGYERYDAYYTFYYAYYMKLNSSGREIGSDEQLEYYLVRAVKDK